MIWLQSDTAYSESAERQLRNFYAASLFASSFVDRTGALLIFDSTVISVLDFTPFSFRLSTLWKKKKKGMFMVGGICVARASKSEDYEFPF